MRTAVPIAVSARPAAPAVPLFGTMRAQVVRLDKDSPEVEVLDRTREDYPTTEGWILGGQKRRVVTMQWGGWGGNYSFYLGLPPKVPTPGLESDCYYFPG
jgi:hypothetical protein